MQGTQKEVHDEIMYVRVGKKGDCVMVGEELHTKKEHFVEEKIHIYHPRHCMLTMALWCSAAASAVIEPGIQGIGVGWMYTTLGLILVVKSGVLLPTLLIFGSKWRKARIESSDYH